MTPDEIARLFTRDDGSFHFARWGRPIAPVVFGVDDATIGVFKGAFEAVVTLAGHKMAETDPDLGTNAPVFCVSDWSQLAAAKHMEKLVPGIDKLAARLQEAEAGQYRAFRVDDTGAIQAVLLFLRIDDQMAKLPAEVLALSHVVQSMLMWSDAAFRGQSPLAVVDGNTILRPEIADVIRAAYDPVLPSSADDPSFALRLAARMEKSE
ncbi:hypothetical protein [Chachezhania antarctica]|uniref:hypothetical protein n=1 Tax=Chachezhania antarctica TaxID=2340860 RepID=UPI000EAC3AA5|nr:hypothetical protein [Chachezhania antarctica]